MIIETIFKDKNKAFIDFADVLCIHPELILRSCNNIDYYALFCEVAGKHELIRLAGLYKEFEADKRIRELIELENFAERLEERLRL